MTIPENLQDIIQKGTKEEKIAALESTSSIADTRILETVISIFDDSDIELRGEAFSALLLNNNDISETVLRGLKSQSKNIRSYSALVLANRNERKAIPEIIQLTEDESAMVRSCAVGALGFLRASEAKSVIQKCIDDPNIEVKKSAIKSAIDIKDKSLLSKLDFLSQTTDPDINKLIALARNNL